MKRCHPVIGQFEERMRKIDQVELHEKRIGPTDNMKVDRQVWRVSLGYIIYKSYIRY